MARAAVHKKSKRSRRATSSKNPQVGRRAHVEPRALLAEPEPVEVKDGEVEKALRSGEHSGLLEDYFGAAQYAELKRLSSEAASRGVRGGDRVLILPGIMG